MVEIVSIKDRLDLGQPHKEIKFKYDGVEYTWRTTSLPKYERIEDLLEREMEEYFSSGDHD